MYINKKLLLRSTHQEMTALKERVCYTHRFREEGAHHATGSHVGKQQRQSGGRGRKRRTWARAFVVVDKGRSG